MYDVWTECGRNYTLRYGTPNDRVFALKYAANQAGVEVNTTHDTAGNATVPLPQAGQVTCAINR